MPTLAVLTDREAVGKTGISEAEDCRSQRKEAPMTCFLGIAQVSTTSKKQLLFQFLSCCRFFCGLFLQE